MLLNKINFIKGLLVLKDFRVLRSISLCESKQFFGVQKYAKLSVFLSVREKIRSKITNPSEYLANLKEACQKNSRSIIFAEDIRNIVAMAENDEDLNFLKKALLQFSSQKNVVQYDSFFFGPEVMRLLYVMDKPDQAVDLVKDPNLSVYFQHTVTLLLLFELLFRNSMYDSIINIYEYFQEIRENKKHPQISRLFYFAACYKLNNEEALKKATNAWYSELQVYKSISLRGRLLFVALLLNQNHCPIDIMKSFSNNFNSLRDNFMCMVLAKGNRFQDVFRLIKDNMHSENARHFLMTEEALSFMEKEVRNSSEENIVKFYTIQRELNDKKFVISEPLETFLLGDMIMRREDISDKTINCVN